MSENLVNTSTHNDKYTAESLQVLEGLQAVRKRPGMYIGDTSSRGLHHLVTEIVDNSVDEALAGFCSQISVHIHADGSISIEDDGRGIPVEKRKDGQSGLELVMTVLHAGGKFNNNAYKVSGGLHGVGASVVNALSSHCSVEIKRDGYAWKQTYKKGVPVSVVEKLEKTDLTGTKTTFKPDGDIFHTENKEALEFNYDLLVKRFREIAFLNAGLKVSLFDERTHKTDIFQYKNGIVEFVSHINESKKKIHNSVIYFKDQKENVEVEIAMQWTDSYTESVYTYCNNINTQEGGTHLFGFRSGFK